MTKGILSSFFCLSFATGISLFSPLEPASAQSVVPDTTLSGNGFTDSVVNQVGNNYTITGGTEVGTNLFQATLKLMPLGTVVIYG